MSHSFFFDLHWVHNLMISKIKNGFLKTTVLNLIVNVTPKYVISFTSCNVCYESRNVPQRKCFQNRRKNLQNRKKKIKKTKEERFLFKIEETLSNQDSFFETEKIFFLFRGEILLQLEDFLNQQIKNLRSSIRNNDVLPTMWTFFIKSTCFLWQLWWLPNICCSKSL